MFKYLPTDSEHIHVYGRTKKTNPMPLFWTASGVEFNTRATECFVTLEADYSASEVWIEVEMNDCLLQRFVVPKGKNEFLLFKGFTDSEVRTIKVRMSSQPIQDDQARKLLIHEICADRELEAVVAKKRKIEFVGDSLTSGEGLTGRGNDDVWCAGIFGLQGHYGLMCAKYFDADYSIVSQSGWGVCTGWDNNINNVIPVYYEQVCGVLAGSVNDKLGAFDAHDFTKWQPDVVVINLSTNDGGALHQAPWTDPKTGIRYKMHLGSDGSGMDEDSAAKFEGAAVAFLKKVRKNNPNAYIVWAYGMCDHEMEKYVLEAIETYKTESGDEKMTYVSLPEAKKEQLGSHGHPGVLDHAAAGEVLINHIKELGF